MNIKKKLYPAPVATRTQATTDPETLTPKEKLLSNGRYPVMVTNADGGYSCWLVSAQKREFLPDTKRGTGMCRHFRWRHFR